MAQDNLMTTAIDLQFLKKKEKDSIFTIVLDSNGVL